MGHQPRSGPATLDRQGGRRRLDDGLAGPAGIARPDMADHLQPGRDLLQHLGHVLTEAGQARGIGAAAVAGKDGFVQHRLTRQVLRQRSA